jgi:NADPH2:quinone reductase
MRAIRVTEFGDADALEEVKIDAPEPGPDQVRIDVEAAGINFADVMQRRGHYRGGPEPSFVPGMEAAGVVETAGKRTDWNEGDRVVATVAGGAYAEQAVADGASAFAVPESMSSAEAAGFPVQFLTAHACLFEWGGLSDGERVLIHAAAGGVGTAATQLAAAEDVQVFATASTNEKRDLAEELGADHAIDYTETGVAATVDGITGGDPLDLVLDGVGGDAFEEGLEALGFRGRLVAYGVASGDVPSVTTPTLLFENKSVIGFHLGRATERDPRSVLKAVPGLQERLTAGDLEVIVGERFDLADACDAHEHIESRSSVGKVVLEP